MNIDCNGCGHCCFSPLNETVVSLVKDEKTKHLLKNEQTRLLHIGVILPEKVTRSGTVVFKWEIEDLIGHGLLPVLAPHFTLIPTAQSRFSELLKDIGLEETIDFFRRQQARLITFRFRHIVMPYEMDDGFQVPVFACVFFNPKRKKCEIFDKSYKPLQCRMFPFNEMYVNKKPEVFAVDRHLRLRKIPIEKHPMCDAWRLDGELTSEQKNEVIKFKKLERGMMNFCFLPITEDDMGEIGGTLKDLDYLVDYRKTLPLLLNRVFSRVYRSENLEPSLSKRESEFVEYLNQKIISGLEWWTNVTFSKGEIFEMVARMEEIFFDRIMTRRSTEKIR